MFFSDYLIGLMWLWVKTNGTILGQLNSPPILEPILVGIGMFTGGTIWILAMVYESRRCVKRGFLLEACGIPNEVAKGQC